MTKLCVTIFVTVADQAHDDIRQAVKAGADMVELRIDSCNDTRAISALVARCPVPCILTCRPKWEGGNSELTDDERLMILKASATGNTCYVDIELKTLARNGAAWTPPPERLITSFHDFTTRPIIDNVLKNLNASPASINKIVWRAESVHDSLEAFKILQASQKPTIALCMREAGIISRILAKKFGAFLTFASLKNADNPDELSQRTITDMKRIYRWDKILPTTIVYGLVGQPIVQSQSPAIHNAGFDKIGFDGVYVPFPVNEGYESFKKFMDEFVPFPGLDLSGLSITIPHKENALKYLLEKKQENERNVEIDELAIQIGVVNTIVIDRSAGGVRFHGFSSDYHAMLDSITEKLGIERKDLCGRRVAVLGAGGMGRTAVAAMARCGASVFVFNRDPNRAAALAKAFNGKTGEVIAKNVEDLPHCGCQIYINATKVGMHPLPNAIPFDDLLPRWTNDMFTKDMFVFDAIYNPPQTKLLKQAAEAGAKTLGGADMFVRQAAAQFHAWTKRNAPTDIMRQVIEAGPQS